MKYVHLCFSFTFTVFLPIREAFLRHFLFLLPPSQPVNSQVLFPEPLKHLSVFSVVHFQSVWIQISLSESVCLSTRYNSDNSRLNPWFLRYARMSSGPQKFRAASSTRLQRVHQLWIWGEEKEIPAPQQQMQLSHLKPRKVLNSFQAFSGV